jgi:Arc/MetJ family transcription regulator
MHHDDISTSARNRTRSREAVRTTIRLDDDVLREAKKRAAQRGISFTRLVEEALRETLARDRESEQDMEPVSLTTVGGSGVCPGVDLADSSSLLDVMEGGDGPS